MLKEHQIYTQYLLNLIFPVPFKKNTFRIIQNEFKHLTFFLRFCSAKKWAEAEVEAEALTEVAGGDLVKEGEGAIGEAIVKIIN